MKPRLIMLLCIGTLSAHFVHAGDGVFENNEQKQSALLQFIKTTINAAPEGGMIRLAPLHPLREPLTFKDPDSGVILYVESDGRRLTAIDTDGNILWHRNPFVDAHLEPYRLGRPLIVRIGRPPDWSMASRKGKFIAISFNFSQFGMMDVTNGDFIFRGQD